MIEHSPTFATLGLFGEGFGLSDDLRDVPDPVNRLILVSAQEIWGTIPSTTLIEFGS